MSSHSPPADAPLSLPRLHAMPSAPARVCAVCVTFHPDADLPQRLAKVLPQVAHLVIVDNGSSAVARAMLDEIGTWPQVSIVFLNENLGSARGLNIGVDTAIRRECDFALLLDQDSRVNDDIVSVLTRIHQSHAANNRLAIVGASYTDSPQASGLEDDELAFVEVEAVIASGTLLWLPAFRDIGPFRDEFFIDFVDNEYCLRARQRGYLVIKAQRPLMMHVIGDASPQRRPRRYIANYPPERLYYQARNDTVLLHESGRYGAGRWQIKSFARTFRRCKRVVLFERDKASKVRGLMQGWYDGVRGRLGKRK